MSSNGYFSNCLSPHVTNNFRVPLPKTCPVLPINSNSPYHVLQNKGRLNISHASDQVRTCPSNLKLNFFTEESKSGETTKIFRSDRYFKNGKLIYSSTQERTPDKTSKSFTKWEKNKKKNLSAGTGKRHAFSEVNLYDVEDENRSRYLHTIRSQNIHRKIGSPHSPKMSPRSFKYFSSYQQPPKIRYPEKPKRITTLPNVTISSEKSRIYSSPKEYIVKISRREKHYKTPTLLPEPRFRRDLFVIPKHTCRKKVPVEAMTYVSQKPSHWDKVRRLISSPRFKYKIYRRIADSSAERKKLHSEISHFGSPHGKYVRFTPSPKSGYKRETQQNHRKERKEDFFQHKNNIGEPCYQVYTMHKTGDNTNRNDKAKYHVKEEHPFRRVQRIGKGTLNSERPFKEENKFSSKQETYYRYSPRKSEYLKVRKNNSEPFEVTVREESIKDYLSHLEKIEDEKAEAEMLANIVNNEVLNEYRERCAKYSPDRSDEEDCEWTLLVTEDYNEKIYLPEHCEACDIERFWDE